MPARPLARLDPVQLPPSRAENLDSLRAQIDRLLEEPRDGVYGVDRSGRATLVTPAVAAITGHTLGDLVGSAMHELLHHSHANGDCYPRDHCPIYAAFKDGRVHHAEEVFWRKDGTSFPVEYTSTPLVQGGDVVGAVVVFRDVGQRRALHDRLRRALAQLGLEAPGRDEGGEGTEHRPSHPGTPPLVDLDRAPVGASPAWCAAMDLVRRVAPVDTTVLLLGESGTGKELVARAVHDRSPRRGRPLVKLNCAAMPTNLVESELFGHERGAFTGATAQRIGRFEQAEDGTLFLDEVGELPLEAQAKLLRVLQEREFERVGGTRTIQSRARVIAATNRDLQGLVQAGRFRADLFHRLDVFPMRLPPLRERRCDIPLLAAHFLQRLEPRLGRPLRGFTAEGERRLCAHDWPGNVRELENVIERAALMADGAILEIPPLGEPRPDRVEEPRPAALDRATMVTALERAGWKITGPRGAAAALGIHPNTLRNRMQRLGIERP